MDKYSNSMSSDRRNDFYQFCHITLFVANSMLIIFFSISYNDMQFQATLFPYLSRSIGRKLNVNAICKFD